MKTYTIYRFFYDGMRTTVRSGVTLEEALEHCNDPITRKDGEWFDGYMEDNHERQ